MHVLSNIIEIIHIDLKVSGMPEAPLGVVVRRVCVRWPSANPAPSKWKRLGSFLRGSAGACLMIIYQTHNLVN